MSGEPKTYFIETWGCQMNVHDSEKLAGTLETEGLTPAKRSDDADVVLLNTCSIREKAAEKVFGELGRLKSIKDRRPGMVLGVCGCVAQQEGENIARRAPYVDLVLGPRATGSLPEMLRLAGDRGGVQVDTAYRRDSIEYPFDKIRREGAGTAKAFVTIVEGCNHRCTYCIVPTTRGREVYRPMGDVLREVRALAERGVLEVEFLGQTVNAYRDGQGNTLAELLREAAAVDGIRRIRFTTSHPAQMTDPILDAMESAHPVVCPYLHLPVQSGSSRVLKDMRRGYDRDRYLRRIDALRSRIPEIALGTDVIVGFPTETAEDFEETLSLLDAVEYDTCYSFAYSPRPGTAALHFVDRVPQEEKFRRLQVLQHHQKAIQDRRMQRWIGRDVEVLVEGPSKRREDEWTGRTPESRVVNFAGTSSVGRLETVRVLRATAFSLRGEPIRVPA
jgi:tRNA-2-methylthio-N6-dimethylallyladenosine synthase